MHSLPEEWPPGDKLLSKSMAALGEGNVTAAQLFFNSAVSSYEELGLEEDRQDLVAAVSVRIAAQAAKTGKGTARIDPNKVAVSEAGGDALLLEATAAFRSKDYALCFTRINEARTAFASVTTPKSFIYCTVFNLNTARSLYFSIVGG